MITNRSTEYCVDFATCYGDVGDAGKDVTTDASLHREADNTLEIAAFYGDVRVEIRGKVHIGGGI